MTIRKEHPTLWIETNRISCTCDCSDVCFSSNIIIYIVGFCGRAYQTGSCFSLSLYFSFQIYHFRFRKRTTFLMNPTIFVAYFFLKRISRFLKNWYCQGWQNIWSNFNDHRSLSLQLTNTYIDGKFRIQCKAIFIVRLNFFIECTSTTARSWTCPVHEIRF